MSFYLNTIRRIAFNAIQNPNKPYLEALNKILRICDLADKRDAKIERDWLLEAEYHGFN